MAIKPIFLFSLPRAGSTLVQRVLSMHPAVATTAEPWILLPLLGAHEPDVILSQYSQLSCHKAMGAFIEQCGDSVSIQSKALRNYGMTYYNSFERDEVAYFLDKTPRYHFGAPRIARAFGNEGRYILLWRNPLAVLASIVETFGAGRWNLHRWCFDLYAGFEGLWRLKYDKPENLIEIHYEKLVAEDHGEWVRLFQALNLQFHEDFLTKLQAHRISGFGDPTGQERHPKLTPVSINTWRNSFSTPQRKRFAKKWLNWLGSERLLEIGYSMSELLEQIDAIPIQLKQCCVDLPYLCRDQVGKVLELDALYRRINACREGRRSFPWS